MEVPHGCLHHHAVRLLGGESVGVHFHLFSQGAVCHSQVSDGGAIFRRGLFQIGKCHGHVHGVVCCAGVVTPLTGGLLTFPQVGLRFDEIFLEFSPGLFLLRLGSPGSTVFLELPRLCNDAVGDADNFSLYDGLARRGRIINTLIQPRVEAFKWFFGIEGLPELPFFLRQVCRRYPRVVHVEVAEEVQHGGSGVAGESVLQGGEVFVLK